MDETDARRPSLDTVIKVVLNLVDKQPDQELFVFYKEKVRTAYTSRQLFELAGKFARRLRYQYGLRQGDVVANTLSNSPERLITDLGVTLAGCVGLNGQILLSDGEDFFLNARRSRAQAVVVNPKETSPAWRLIKPYIVDVTSSHTVLSCDRAPELTTAITVSRETTDSTERGRQPFLKELEDSNEEIFVESSVKPEDTVMIFNTSGSTGYSKLVPRSHDDVTHSFIQMPLMMGSSGALVSNHQDIHYNDRPLGWGGGYPMGTYLTGIKRVMSDTFDTTGLRSGEDIWQIITQEGCTVGFILPLDLQQVVTHVKQLDDARYKLKRVACGGQPMTQRQIENMQVIARELLVVYGSTEVGLLAMELVTDSEYHEFSVGKPQQGLALKIVDENTYQERKPGQIGMILAKGRTVFAGYYNRLEDPDPNTAKIFTKDGWFITEDLGYFDDEGRLYVLGRNKDVIMYGAAVVYPGWLEARIVKHPDVMDACVVPISDPVLFHNICACVRPQPGSGLNEETLQSFCKQMFLLEVETEGVPVPKHFLILDNFPKTASGKPDKKIMIAMAEERFGHKDKALQ